MKRFLPLLIFLPLLGIMIIGLRLDPSVVPSPLVGQPAPSFVLPRLEAPEQNVTPADFIGQVWLLNVWASWCFSCRAEHHLLTEQLQNRVMLVGLNYKDAPAEALAWLARLGDPYTVSAADRHGLAGLDWGVYGVPETFVIDRAGIIRHKHIGPLDQSAIDETIVPLVQLLQTEQPT